MIKLTRTKMGPDSRRKCLRSWEVILWTWESCGSFMSRRCLSRSTPSWINFHSNLENIERSITPATHMSTAVLWVSHFNKSLEVWSLEFLPKLHVGRAVSNRCHRQSTVLHNHSHRRCPPCWWWGSWTLLQNSTSSWLLSSPQIAEPNQSQCEITFSLFCYRESCLVLYHDGLFPGCGCVQVLTRDC